MRRFLYLSLLLAIPGLVAAQTKTTQALAERYTESMSLFFYKNTPRMLNQTEDKEFDEMIKDIDKLRLLLIDKEKNFSAADYKRITGDYQKEAYEPIMTSRAQGRNFDIFLRETQGQTKGMVVLVNDSSSLYVLDIIGKISINNVTGLFNKLDQSSDISKKIKNFAERDERKKARKEEEDKDSDN